MKKQFTIIFFCLTNLIFGQTNIMNVGIDFGIGYKSLYGNEYIKDYRNDKIGTIIGVYFQYNFKNNLSFKTGGYFENKGSNIKIHDSGIYLIGKENFDYITIPLLFKYSLINRINFFVNTGPYFGYLIKQSSYLKQYNSSVEYKENNINSYKKVEMGLTGGIGLFSKLDDKFLYMVEIRENIGLTNISLHGNLKTNSILFIFTIAYKIGVENTQVQ